MAEVKYVSATRVYTKGAPPAGVHKDERDRRVREAARLLDLDDQLLERKPKQLSGGQRDVMLVEELGADALLLVRLAESGNPVVARAEGRRPRGAGRRPRDST